MPAFATTDGLFDGTMHRTLEAKAARRRAKKDTALRLR